MTNKKKLDKILGDTIFDSLTLSNSKLTESDIRQIENDIKDLESDENPEDYVSQSHTEEISFIELAIINDYLHDSFRGNHKDVIVNSYGIVDGIGRISFGGLFDNTSTFWFNAKMKGDDNDFIFQTKTFIDNRNELVCQLQLSVKKGIVNTKFDELLKKLKSLAFNNSQYKGKCIKVKLIDGSFKGIEIIDIGKSSNELILNETQIKFIDHFVHRVGKGGNARYLLNGQPGTGKTESIREIARRLVPNVTFIIPDFETSDDLNSILEACEIFDNAVIIMDDIDLYLGSRENGSYTRLLGQFLSFFDGVKKRNISILASTNDKGLVDHASSRPGRFNIILDYSFLTDEQIEKVCNLFIPKKWLVKEFFDVIKGKINGKKANITGSFIANLADNIKEMSEDNKDWGIKDTISLLTESYLGFYQSQINVEKERVGFKTN